MVHNGRACKSDQNLIEKKRVSTGVPALPRDTYHVCPAINVDSRKSATFSACH